MSVRGGPGRYPAEFRERAVRMVFEAERRGGSQWEAISSVAEKQRCSTAGRLVLGMLSFATPRVIRLCFCRYFVYLVTR